MPVDRIGILIAVYPAVWGIAQLATGALSDRWGRKHLITAGMLTQAAGLALIATGHTFTWWPSATALLGAGTAMVYPTLLAAVGDVRPSTMAGPRRGGLPPGRDSGYAAGHIVGGVTADLWGLRAAIWAAAVIAVASGLAVAVRMYETTRLQTGPMSVSEHERLRDCR
jgi:MFS family permease